MENQESLIGEIGNFSVTTDINPTRNMYYFAFFVFVLVLFGISFYKKA